MTKIVIDLMREYVRVADMCEVYNREHGTDIKPWECVKRNGNTLKNWHLNFDCDLRIYSFDYAVAILEGEPVFVGDEVYQIFSGERGVVASLGKSNQDEPRIKVETERYGSLSDPVHNWTWTKPAPRRTFLLNGVELPCPGFDYSTGNNIDISFEAGDKIEQGSIRYTFDSKEDLIRVKNEITQILDHAKHWVGSQR